VLPRSDAFFFPFQGSSPKSDPSMESKASSRVGDAILVTPSVSDGSIGSVRVRVFNDELGETCESLKETRYPKMMSTDKFKTELEPLA
jgi:hypothetical protein